MKSEARPWVVSLDGVYALGLFSKADANRERTLLAKLNPTRKFSTYPVFSLTATGFGLDMEACKKHGVKWLEALHANA